MHVPQGYAPIRQDFEDFYTRRMYYRLHVCINKAFGMFYLVYNCQSCGEAAALRFRHSQRPDAALRCRIAGTGPLQVLLMRG